MTASYTNIHVILKLVRVTVCDQPGLRVKQHMSEEERKLTVIQRKITDHMKKTGYEQRNRRRAGNTSNGDPIKCTHFAFSQLETGPHGAQQRCAGVEIFAYPEKPRALQPPTGAPRVQQSQIGPTWASESR